MNREPRLPLARYGLLFGLFLVAASHQVRLTYDAVSDLLHATERARRPFRLRDANARFFPVILEPRPEAAQAGLVKGDTVVAVAGRPFSGTAPLLEAVAAAKPGDALRVTVRHPDAAAEETHTVTLAPIRTQPPPLAQWLYTIVASIVSPWLCLCLGFWVAAVRTRDHRAWLFLALMLSFAFFGESHPEMWGPGWREVGVLYSAAQFVSWPIWMLLFGIYFPERLALDARMPWLKWLLIVPLTVWGLGRLLVELANVRDFGLAAPIFPMLRFGGVALALIMISIGIFFACLGAKEGMATDPDSRRRLRLLNRGTHVAMAPLFLLVVASLVRWGADDITRWPPWVYMPTFVMVFVFPLTMAYVIVVERAMDVRVVLRQGVQYALARGGLRILQAAAVVAIIAAILELNQKHDEGLLFRIGVIAAGSAAVLLIRRLGPRVALAVDRRFFRDAYDAETILTELAEEVRTMVETQPLLRRVAECLSAALHVPRVALLVQRDGCYRPAFATGYDGMPEVAFPESAATVERLRTSGAPLLTHRGEAGSWLRQLPAERVQERAGIENLGSELLLPLAAREKLLGMMSLGAKRSEEPFSPSDLRLLRSVAAQTGLALENSRLTDAIAREVAHSARERRELEIAREVQEQFFPHDLPPVAGLDYCGGCRPARHVGGDYYDFLMLAGFGFAIGDVSGKGVPAALLMAGLQASLRAHALQGAHDLAALMANVNRLVCDCSSPNRYATFFYGQIDPESRVLSYVNAGHNAPMIFRGGELLRLSIGGPVVGLLPMATYEQASLTLQPGDLIVGFTDGVSESMNAADEEWGEERLAAAVRACGGACAAEIVKRIMAEAEGFAAGAPQHDDMTLVVLRVT